jgi:hypothetical protein
MSLLATFFGRLLLVRRRMPHLPYSIELHDSQVAAIEATGNSLVFKLNPAYVHRNGKGWRQDAEIVIAGSVADIPQMELPSRISDGTLETAKGPYHNLLMLPLHDPGPILLSVEFQSGAVLRVRGDSAEIRLFGEPEYVETYA